MTTRVGGFLLGFVLAAGSTSVDLPNWAQWGILGAAVVALATGKFLVPAYLYTAERRDRIAAEDRERALRQGEVVATQEALREQNTLLTQIATILQVTRA
jgi:hypothetical protein